MASFEDRDPMSAPLSPNRVREGHSQDMPAEGSILDVSPDLQGFNMRPAGGGLQLAEITPPPPSTYVNFNFFGAPLAFAQCHKTPGMDTPMTLPLYNIPKDGNIGFDQSAVPTVFASGVSPDSIPWSTAEDIIRDIVREGPFDTGATPMDTEDSPLIITGYARLPVPHDIVHGDSTGGCGCNVWATTPSPPVSEVHWSSGVGEITEPFTIFLSEPLGPGMCYGGGRQPAERCWSYDVESSNSGTIRDVVASDVVGNDEYWC